MAFGRDGFLDITAGDGTSDSDAWDSGQTLDDLLGGVLRIDVDRRDGDRRYGIPADNPSVGRPGARPEIWAYGLRNPWRIGSDPKTGHIWVGNNAQDLWETAHLVRRGENYGWSVSEEGRHRRTPAVGRVQHAGGDRQRAPRGADPRPAWLISSATPGPGARSGDQTHSPWGPSRSVRSRPPPRVRAHGLMGRAFGSRVLSVGRALATPFVWKAIRVTGAGERPGAERSGALRARGNSGRREPQRASPGGKRTRVGPPEGGRSIRTRTTSSFGHDQKAETNPCKGALDGDNAKAPAPASPHCPTRTSPTSARAWSRNPPDDLEAQDTDNGQGRVPGGRRPARPPGTGRRSGGRRTAGRGGGEVLRGEGPADPGQADVGGGAGRHTACLGA
jgi:hypothetical protein